MFATIFGIDCNFSLFYLFNWKFIDLKIGRALEILRPGIHKIGIVRAIYPGLLNQCPAISNLENFCTVLRPLTPLPKLGT